jgi:hypothetical protein
VSTELPNTQWLTIPDLVEVLGQSQSQVRRLIEDNALAAVRIDGVLKVPAVFLRDGEPIHELKGTIVLLRDCGFNDDELVDWLLSEEESLGTSPINALSNGRKTEVRRIAQALL